MAVEVVTLEVVQSGVSDEKHSRPHPQPLQKLVHAKRTIEFHYIPAEFYVLLLCTCPKCPSRFKPQSELYTTASASRCLLEEPVVSLTYAETIKHCNTY